MKAKLLYGYCILLAVLSVSVMSCSDSGDVDNGEDTPISPEEVGNILEKASKDWGASQAEIISCMQGFRQVSGTAADMLQFKSAGNGVSIAYRFAGDKLMATSVLIPGGTGGLDFSSLIGGYTYVGELGGGNVYADFPANTMACTWQPVKWDDGYGAVGYAPIKTDDYDFITPVTVTTDADVEAGMLEATLSGRVEGSTGDVKVGFMYGLDSSLSDAESVMATPDADGSFSITVNGLIDDADYYYCAYALFDGISYMGDVQSFHTEQLTYTLGGKTFKMIKVEGGPDGDFSMMQTELLHDMDLQIGSISFGRLGRYERGVSVGELRSLAEKIYEETGLQFRLPTEAEWMFAAGGGNKSNDYKYSGSNTIGDVAWYSGNSKGSGHSIATKEPNELGFYDMSGNYAEVCHNEDSSNEFNVDGHIYGGCWSDPASSCTVTSWKTSPVAGDIEDSRFKEKNAYDTKYIAVRLVYSRD